MAPSPASRSRTSDAVRLGRMLRATSKAIPARPLAEVVDAILHPRRTARRLVEHAVTVLYAKVSLRVCDRVGVRPRCFGPAWIENKGAMVLGDDVTLGDELGSVSLTTAPGGSLFVGDRVTVHHGSWISAAREVTIGSDVTIGPYCVVADADADTPGCREDATPVAIASGARLGARVVVRPGARIGEGAVIGAGSVVEGKIPPRALAFGVPARVIGVRGQHIRDRSDERSERVPASGRRLRFAEREISDACC